MENYRKNSLNSYLTSIRCSVSRPVESQKIINFSKEEYPGETSLHGSRTQKNVLEDEIVRVIEWRKNLSLPIVAIRNCEYAMIKTANKRIAVPTKLEHERIVERLN